MKINSVILIQNFQRTVSCTRPPFSASSSERSPDVAIMYNVSQSANKIDFSVGLQGHTRRQQLSAPRPRRSKVSPSLHGNGV